MLITLPTMIDIWNITSGDEVSEDPKAGQHCLMNTNKKKKKYANLLSTEHHQLSNVWHDSTLCRTRQMGAAAEHCDVVSSLAL